MNEEMNNVITRLINEGRKVRFEARQGDWTNRYRVCYRFANENGRTYTVLNNLFSDDAKALVDYGNQSLGSILT